MIMIWSIILFVIICLIFIFFIFSAFVAYKLVTPSRFIAKWTPRDFGAEYKDIELITEDGLKLKGWDIENGEKCVIVLHGYSRSRWDEVYMKKVMENLWKNGYSLVVFDFRAHGESEGKHTTLGDKEFLDVKAALNYAKDRYKEIYLIGYSMGGFLALKIAAYGLAKKVIADSPYIYTDRTGARGLKYFANLPEWLYIFVKPFALIISRANFENTDPFKFAKNIRVPMLIIAGKNDPLIRIGEIQEFINNTTKFVELWLTDGAHVRSIQINEKKYFEKVLSFLNQ